MLEGGLADVDPRLDDEGHPWMNLAGRADVVHVHADEVQKAVGRPDLELRAGLVGNQPQLEQSSPDHFLAGLLDLRERHPGLDRAHASLLCSKDDLVDRPLLRRERSVHWIRSRDVPCIPLEVGSGVHQEQVARFHPAPR